MITAEKKYLSTEDYLKIEREAEIKSEYYKGEMFPMSGASLKHNRITINIISTIAPKLRNSDCNVFGSDMRVNVSVEGLFTYPDISVAKGEVELYDDVTDTILNPKVIIEVLSKSTRNYDRGDKFKLYRRISTLEDYILVSQDEVRIEHFHKHNESEWVLKEFKSKEETINLNSIGCCLKINDIYFNLKF